jgi:hypothetical protein
MVINVHHQQIVNRSLSRSPPLKSALRSPRSPRFSNSAFGSPMESNIHHQQIIDHSLSRSPPPKLALRSPRSPRSSNIAFGSPMESNIQHQLRRRATHLKPALRSPRSFATHAHDSRSTVAGGGAELPPSSESPARAYQDSRHRSTLERRGPMGGPMPRRDSQSHQLRQGPASNVTRIQSSERPPHTLHDPPAVSIVATMPAAPTTSPEKFVRAVGFTRSQAGPNGMEAPEANAHGTVDGQVRRKSDSCGIGVQLVKCPNNDILVLSVREGSSAEEAGVGEGDRVVGVDGADISGQGLDCRQVASLIAGPEGSEVRLRVVGAQGREDEVVVPRRRAPPVSHEELARAEEAAQMFLRRQRDVAAGAGGLSDAQNDGDADGNRQRRSGTRPLSATDSRIAHGGGGGEEEELNQRSRMEDAAQNGGKADPSSDSGVLVYSDFREKTRGEEAAQEQGPGEDVVLPADLPRMIRELKELMRKAQHKARAALTYLTSKVLFIYISMFEGRRVQITTIKRHALPLLNWHQKYYLLR